MKFLKVCGFGLWVFFIIVLVGAVFRWFRLFIQGQINGIGRAEGVGGWDWERQRVHRWGSLRKPY